MNDAGRRSVVLIGASAAEPLERALRRAQTAASIHAYDRAADAVERPPEGVALVAVDADADPTGGASTLRALSAVPAFADAPSLVLSRPLEDEVSLAARLRGLLAGSASDVRFRGELEGALARGELAIWVQPELDLASGTIHAAEALVRWPGDDMPSPAAFVPFAEASGLVVPMGAWVLRETLKVARRARAVVPDFRVYCNVSAIQLRDHTFLGAIAALAAAGEELRGLGVELTERVAMHDPEVAIEALGAIREFGVTVALDDFGTGYSSLAYLKRLPVDVVKLDGSFVRGLPRDPSDAAVAEAVALLARRLGMTALAEGVETSAQLDFIRRAGYASVQGFLVARPMPVDDFLVWLARHHHAPLATGSR